ncbi:MAG: hypothetical protein H6686_05465 [Fibrobacteria bacterium]|nr:hypothetical protein [Fibrobacteria bacterium]
MKATPRILLLALGLSLAPWLASCGSSSGERTAGGEDFPNSLEALGAALVESLDSSRSWNALENASPGTISGTNSDIASAAPAAARRVLLECRPESTTTLSGDWAVIFSVECPEEGGRKYDSLVIRPADSLVRILVKDSTGPLGLVGVRETYRPADTTLTGFPLLGSRLPIRILRKERLGGLVTTTNLVIDGGPDSSYAAGADNGLWSGSRMVVRENGDTLDRWSVLPWPDTSGPIYTHPTDSGLVTLDRRQVLGTGGIRTESSVIQAFREESRNYPRRFRSRLERDGDAWVEQAVFGSRQDSTFFPGDTAIFRKVRVLSRDTLLETVLVRTSLDPVDRQGDRLVRLTSHRLHGADGRQVFLDAQPDHPLEPDAPFTDGTIELRVIRASGDTLRFQGRMTGGTSQGTWKSSDGSGHVVFDNRGKVRSSP